MSNEQVLPRVWFDRLRRRVRDGVAPTETALHRPITSELPVGVRGLPPNLVLAALDRFRAVVAERKCERKPGEKLPRATELRPYRFCVQDVVLAIWAMAHRKDEGDIYVDVFLTSEVYDKANGERGFYDDLAGATAAMLTALSEAYRVGAPLQIQFGPNVENGCVPLDVLRLAFRHGISISRASDGKINADEGRALYLALTGFRAGTRRAIELLHRRGLMSPERAAYIVHHGVWSLAEVEGIVLCSRYPDLVLSGDVAPENRHLFQHVLVHSRLALLGGLLDRSLAARNDVDARPGEKTPGLDAEDDERNLDIRTNARLLGREYELIPSTTPDQLPLPDWECTTRRQLNPKERLSVLLRPRSAASLDARLEADIAQAATRAGQDPRPTVVAVAVCFDFHDLPTSRQEHFRDEAAKRNVELLVCPEATRALDQLAQKKITASRIKKD